MNAAVNTSGLTAAQTGLACVTPPCPQRYPTATGPAGKQAARRCTAVPRAPQHTSLGLLEAGDDFSSSCTSKFSMEMLGRQLAQLYPMPPPEEHWLLEAMKQVGHERTAKKPGMLHAPFSSRHRALCMHRERGDANSNCVWLER